MAKGIPPIFPTMYEKEASGATSEERREEFVSLAERCQREGVQLVVYFPPQYYHYSGITPTIRFVEEYCKEHHIPCFNDSQNEEFLHNKEWFYDNVHLNKNGAVIYSNMFVNSMRKYKLDAQ